MNTAGPAAAPTRPPAATEEAPTFPCAPAALEVPSEGVHVWNRDLGVLEREPVMAESGLRWLYGESRLGRFARSFLRQRPVSALYGLWQNRRIRTSRL
ncbi:MAG: hypothetical protein ACYTFT_03930, partial [Planctomycetota bacterium]